MRCDKDKATLWKAYDPSADQYSTLFATLRHVSCVGAHLVPAHTTAAEVMGNPVVPAHPKQRWQALQDHRQQLPIWTAKEKLLALLQRHQTVVLVGETGSGKTTQVPQFLLEGGFAGEGMIACTQPRRVAAITVAKRVAQEQGVQPGTQVGYAVRFEDNTTAATRIKYMTDGILLREALLDPALKRYQVVIVDEAHERSVQSDLLFGLLKGIQARRGHNFWLVIMSATLVAAQFVGFFPGAAATYVQGRQFPVQVFYTASPEEHYVDAAVVAVLQVAVEEGAGDVLVFLTGQEEIEAVQRLLQDRANQLPAKYQSLAILPLFAALPPDQQARVFQPAPVGARKVILATNIAETSITVPGVRFTIDTGFVKTRMYNAKVGAESLTVTPISQAQARQRSGRAGREAPGKAFRLYTERSFRQLQPASLPEIQRVDLAAVTLQLKALGVDDVLGFDFLERPPRAALVRSLEELLALGALDSNGRLSPLGRQMSRLPVEPQYAKVLVAAAHMGCSLEALAVVAMAASDQPFLLPRESRERAQEAHKRFASGEGDHMTLLAVFQAFHGLQQTSSEQWCHDNFLSRRALCKAVDIYSQLLENIKALGLPLLSCGSDTTPVRRALTSGLFKHAAKRHTDGTYKVLASSQMVALHPSSVLCGKRPPCCVFSELVCTTRAYARQVTVIDSAWLAELAPAFFSMH
ncbi:hypothetical protein WJX72_001917 [[Myrmecia] bisecta]|uniref:RNA helicase n=1 Tax=[Myrmecia] bisecta TaxID=41462 RepID=A0AAW1R438_9CHLO